MNRFIWKKATQWHLLLHVKYQPKYPFDATFNIPFLFFFLYFFLYKTTFYVSNVMKHAHIVHIRVLIRRFFHVKTLFLFISHKKDIIFAWPCKYSAINLGSLTHMWVWLHQLCLHTRTPFGRFAFFLQPSFTTISISSNFPCFQVNDALPYYTRFHLCICSRMSHCRT